MRSICTENLRKPSRRQNSLVFFSFFALANFATLFLTVGEIDFYRIFRIPIIAKKKT